MPEETFHHIRQGYAEIVIFALPKIWIDMIDNAILDKLKGRDIVLFVADRDEISEADVRFPVVYTGMGKMRMYNALEKWFGGAGGAAGKTVLNIGSAGSAKYPIGEIVNVSRFVNGGSELIYDCIDLPGKGSSIFSGDYFMSTQTFTPAQVAELSGKYDLFDMEAYAAALFCRTHGLSFYCFKAVSDNLDGSLKDWRSILGDIRTRFTGLLSGL